MDCTTIAEGSSLDQLEATVGGFELPKGTPVRFTMKLKPAEGPPV